MAPEGVALVGGGAALKIVSPAADALLDGGAAAFLRPVHALPGGVQEVLAAGVSLLSSLSGVGLRGLLYPLPSLLLVELGVHLHLPQPRRPLFLCQSWGLARRRRWKWKTLPGFMPPAGALVGLPCSAPPPVAVVIALR